MKLLIPQDKANHALYGALFFALGNLAFGLYAGAAACLGAAIGREAYNRHQGGPFDLKDIAATLAGGALGLLCTF